MKHVVSSVSLFSLLRRERKAFALLAMLLLSMQWMVPVAFASAESGGIEICYGNGDGEDNTAYHGGHCPCVAGCFAFCGTGSSVTAGHPFQVDQDDLAGKAFFRLNASALRAGLQPYDACSRAPPAFS